GSNHQKLISCCPWILAPCTLCLSPDESDCGKLPTAFEPPSGFSEGIKLSGRISWRSQISAVQQTLRQTHEHSREKPGAQSRGNCNLQFQSKNRRLVDPSRPQLQMQLQMEVHWENRSSNRL
ncbi:hypothetical protein M5D96_008804, partial [Drosophila gunungcola]